MTAKEKEHAATSARRARADRESRLEFLVQAMTAGPERARKPGAPTFIRALASDTVASRQQRLGLLLQLQSRRGNSLARGLMNADRRAKRAGAAGSARVIQRQAAAMAAGAGEGAAAAEQDRIASEEILGLLDEFQNIEIAWNEPLPEDFVGPPRGFSVTVQAVYFINSEEARARFGAARARQRFGAITQELADEPSVMVGGEGGERSAGQTVRFGKATPEDIRKFVQTAVETGVIERYARGRGELEEGQQLVDLGNDQIQTIIQGWMAETRVGVDCSGLVAQAVLRVERAQGAAEGLPESELPATARIVAAGTYDDGPQVEEPRGLRPGDAWVLRGGDHIRLVAAVETGEDHVEFVSVESSGGSAGGPGPLRRRWRTNSLDEFDPITLLEGRETELVGGSFHEIP